VWGENPIEDIAVWGLQGDHLNRATDLSSKDAAPYTGSVLAIDPSGKGGDETAWCVTKVLNSKIHVCDFGGYLDGYGPETLRGLAESAKQWKVNAIQVETNFGDGMFEQLLRPVLREVGYPCQVLSERSKGQKERRICDILEPLLGDHRVVIDANALRRDAALREGVGTEAAMNYRLAYQLSRITRERGCLVHDDRIEVLSMACGFWVAAMAKSETEEINEAEERDLDDIVRNWAPADRTPNWHSGYIPKHMA
jgi:hypothetical protein